MREVGVLEAKTHLSSLLDSVEREGEEIAITRHGMVVARLGPPAPKPPNPPKMSGAELVARSIALQERIAARSPLTNDLTWEELKDMGQSRPRLSSTPPPPSPGY